MNAGEAYQSVLYLANKSSYGGFIDPSKFTSLMQQAEMEWLYKQYNNPKQYSRDEATPLYGYAMTQRMRDNIRPYKKSILLTPVNGKAQLPADYLHPIAFFANNYETTVTPSESLDRCYTTTNTASTTTTTLVSVQLLEDDEFGFRVGSVTRKPTLEYPIAKMDGNTITFAPNNTLQPTLYYIKKPIGATFGYTLDADGNAIYDPTTSKSWEAPDDCHNELVEMICQYVGIHVLSTELTEFARYKETTGF